MIRKPEEIERWLIAKLATVTGANPDELGRDASFASYGLESVRLVALSAELESFLGRRLSPVLIFDHPSIASLVRYLTDTSSDPARSGIESGLTANPHPDQTEPIAIVGLGCRFPGAHGPAEFWRLLVDGVDAVGEVPGHRWDWTQFYSADPAEPGKSVSRWGAFLDDVRQFDPAFFGIPPREAKVMDPQQRLLLETTWEALEDSGMKAETLAGEGVGVFVGISANEYGLTTFSDYADLTAASGSGAALSIAANRLSFFFDWHGPSVAVDTACSSSLAAIHLAVRALRDGECTLAAAGGVNVVLNPAGSIALTKAGIMSPTGRCRAFGRSADGYVRGEGCGIVLLRPLQAAIDEGNVVYATIRGTAMGHDGRTNGLMAPSARAQETVIGAACRNAGVKPHELAYVEAHGSGTHLGDMIEARGLGATVGSGVERAGPCVIGSVKSNIGHLESAAGVAGLIKVALSLARETIPATLHADPPNPEIDFQALGLRVATVALPWPDEGRRLAGISSFGFGGANVHAVLESVQSAPSSGTRKSGSDAKDPEGPELLVLSARSDEALRRLAGRWQATLVGGMARKVLLRDICTTASARQAHQHRLAVVAATRLEMGSALGAASRGDAHDALTRGQASAQRSPRIGFVFSGQGTHWSGMATDLLHDEPVFRAAVEACDSHLRHWQDWSVLDALQAPSEARNFAHTNVAQPCLFAVQVGIVDLLKSWGLVPTAVTGHSLGEIAAAYTCGALNLSDAAAIVWHRARIMQQTEGQGAMGVIGASRTDGQNLLSLVAPEVELASINAPDSITISGSPHAVESALAAAVARGLFARRLVGSYAFHSRQMRSLRDQLVAVLQPLSPSECSHPFYSTVTGAVATGRLDGRYWGDNAAQPVLFEAAVGAMIDDGVDAFVEIGSHSVLSRDVRSTLAARGRTGLVLSTMAKDAPARRCLLATVARLHVEGAAVDWKSIYPKQRPGVPGLPSGPWSHKVHWISRRQSGPPLNVLKAGTEDDALSPDSESPCPSPSSARGPEGDTEQRLATIWRGVLAIDDIGPESNFFHVGGDSLAAVELAARISGAFGLPVAPELVYTHPRLIDMAQALTSGAIHGVTIDLALEAALPATIRAEGLEAPSARHRQILLTGATGFIGIHLLSTLLRRTAAHVHCLMRSDSEVDGRTRLEKARQAQRLESIDWSRVHLVSGDLQQRNLGLTDTDFHRLAHSIDTIYHAGAMVDWIRPYTLLKSANVIGTREILAFATTGILKEVHHLSTMWAVNAARVAPGQVLDETCETGWEGLETGYAQSKWVGDLMVREAGRRGIPTAVYRTEFVLGSTAFGIVRPTEFVCRALRDIVVEGVIPAEPIRAAVLPVDLVASMIVALGQATRPEGQAYHLVHSDLTTDQMYQTLTEIGYLVRPVDFASWRDQVTVHRESALSRFRYFLDLYTTESLAHFSSISISHERTRALLAECAPDLLANAPTASQTLRTLIAYLRAEGLLPAPPSDGDSHRTITTRTGNAIP